MFPADLLGFPSEQDVDFAIDLEMGTKTISIPLYQMTPTELKEQLFQLQGLLDLGFIHSSLSSQDAAILFINNNDRILRMSTDYGQLNKVTVKNYYLLPYIDDLFDHLQRDVVFLRSI